MTTPQTLELLKYRLNARLEAQKWRYRQQEIQYLEAGQHLRSLNQLMWQVPGMAIAITGGLWYGAANVAAEAPKAWVLGFVALVDLLTVVTLWRIRFIIGKRIDEQRNFTDSKPGKDRWRNTVIGCWTISLLAAAGVSALGAGNPELLAKAQPLFPAVCCQVINEIKIPELHPVEAICPAPAKKKVTAKPNNDVCK